MPKLFRGPHTEFQMCWLAFAVVVFMLAAQIFIMAPQFMMNSVSIGKFLEGLFRVTQVLLSL